MTNFRLEFSLRAKASLETLADSDPKKYKKVLKTLALMQTNLRHQSLNTHKYENYEGNSEQDVFESYVENKTPGAFRVFWYYGPNKGVITILAITPHP
jgi:hypothetical protein